MGVEGEGLAGGVGGRGSEGGLGFDYCVGQHVEGGRGRGGHTVEACGEGGVRGGAEDEDAYVWVGGGVADDVCEFCPHAAGSAGGGKRCDVLIVEGVYRRPAASAGGSAGGRTC